MDFYICMFMILFCINRAFSVSIPCSKKYYQSFGSDSFVCVCNSTYCDTLESIDHDDIKQFYQEFVTSKGNYRLNKFKNKFESTGSNDSQLVLKIDRSKSYQAIHGFGGAVTDATGYNVFALSQPTINNFLNSYFRNDGIEYNVLRVPLAGVDFSTRTYSYNDKVNDFNLSSFALEMEDLTWKIPIIKYALNISQREIKLFASAWSSPPWMKTNNAYTGKGLLLGEPGGLYYDIWAKYYVKFFEAYKNFGIDFWGVTAQNEPSDCLINDFPFNCLGFTPELQAAFVTKNLGPQLSENGFGDIKIMILDDHRLFLPLFPKRFFDYSNLASKYVSGIAVHWYLDWVVPATVLDKTHNLFPDKFLFLTESCLGQGPQIHVMLGSFARGEDYAKYIIQNLNHWVTGWADWNMALDLNGGPNWSKNFVDAPVIVNATGDEFYKQPIFYVMGHFSKFIPPNSVRIESSSDYTNKLVSYTTFYDQATGQTTLVILNQSEDNIKYSVYDPDLNLYINSIIESHSIKSIVWFNS